MSTPRVKICGITRVEDATRAVELGAAAIGFIFWPGSPRFVDPYRARAIARRLPPLVTAVGVFVNQPAAYLNAVASLVGLGAVQLHGDEDPSLAAGIARPVLKALSGPGIVAEAQRWPRSVLPLVDAYDPVRRGGTGRVADWHQAAVLSAARPIMLSGGLNASNIAAAIAAVRPFAVDVSSGVETAPGIKDHDQLAAFFARLQTPPVGAQDTEVSQ